MPKNFVLCLVSRSDFLKFYHNPQVVAKSEEEEQVPTTLVLGGPQDQLVVEILQETDPLRESPSEDQGKTPWRTPGERLPVPSRGPRTDKRSP